ncbi:MAG: cell division protein FtsQ/DivIB [Elusimicrobiota bacterium]
MKPKMRPRRYRVAARPKAKRQNRQKIFAVFAAVALAAGAAVTVRHLERKIIVLRKSAESAAGVKKAEALPKMVAARLFRQGKPAGFLALDGGIIQAPDSLYSRDIPRVDIGARALERMPDLAGFLKIVSADPQLFSPLIQLKFISDADGWDARFADGAQIKWGDFRWTKLKISRINQVLADAKSRYGEPVNLDLRYFGSGRVILRPPRSKSIATR